MAFLQQMRSPCLSFIQTVLSLLLGGTAILSSYWCVGKQKVPKPLCSPTKQSNCIPVPGVSNSSSIQFSWETGDDRFVFPSFHTGLFITCEENIYTDTWGWRICEPSCSWEWRDGPAAERIFSGLVPLHTALGPASQLFCCCLHSPGSVAWFAFTVCMSAGVSTLNNYTKKVLMVGPRRNSGLNPCSFNFMGLLPPAPYYTPPNPAITLACPQSPPQISHLSPYYEPPSAALPSSTPRLTHSHSLPLPDSFPAHPSHPAPASPFHRLSLPSPSPSRPQSISIHIPLQGHQRHMSHLYEPEEDYSPL
ncbi:hypothetical protein PAMP_009544 [Pampus punctatissimus]